MSGGSVVLCWVPGHAGLVGNQRAHLLATSTYTDQVLSLLPSIPTQPPHPSSPCSPSSSYPITLLPGDFKRSMASSRLLIDIIQAKHFTRSFIFTKWQSLWSNGCRGREMFAVQPNVTMKWSLTARSRNDQVILDHLRLNVAKLNASLYKVNKSESDLCSTCGVPESVVHFLLDCARLDSAAVVLKNYPRFKDYTPSKLLNDSFAFELIKTTLRGRYKKCLFGYL